MIHKLLFLLTAMAGILCGCNRVPDYTPVPLPYGYQRTPLYPAAYRFTDSLPADFAVNDSAVVTLLPGSSSSGVMADIFYPAYGATMHLTFTPVDSATVSAVTANRRERLALNLGDNYATVRELSSGENSRFASTVVTCTGRTPTPIQLLCVSPSMVISGAVRFAPDQADADSLMPVLKAITADVEYATANLR